MQKKELPNPKKVDVIPPDMNHRYFATGAGCPPEPYCRDFSPANAWWFAEFAFLAYCHPGFARLAVKEAGFEDFRFFEGKGTECMISSNAQLTVVAFRGTELKSRSALHEIKTDLNTLPVGFDAGGKVHRGFLEGLEEIWGGKSGLEKELQQLISENPGRPLWITGHSLGGALAALCFARIPEAVGLYLYGAPRVGDLDFVTACGDRPVWRIENARDPVPLVPPDVPKLKFNFADLGQLRFLDWDGTVRKEGPVFVLEDHKAGYREAKDMLDQKIDELKDTVGFSKRRLKASKKLIREIDQHGKITRKEWKQQMKKSLKQFGLSLDDHQPVFYALKTWNALVDQLEISELTPPETF